MKTTFEKGDRVVYKAAFLRSIGWITSVPEVGIVDHAHGKFAGVLWLDNDGRPTGTPVTVNIANLILESEKHLEPA